MLPKYFLPWATKASFRLSEIEPVDVPVCRGPLCLTTGVPDANKEMLGESTLRMEIEDFMMERKRAGMYEGMLKRHLINLQVEEGVT